jgi:hypothetical protein
MKQLVIKSVLAATMLGTLTNCASIVSGSSQSIDFSSQPSGAKITIDGRAYGETPKSISLPRIGRVAGEAKPKKEYAVKIEMEGFYPYEIKLKRELNSWTLGNLLFGGVIGILIDAGSGAMYKLTPDQIIAQMNRSTAMNQAEEGTIYVAVTLTPDPSWEKIGTMEKVK